MGGVVIDYNVQTAQIGGIFLTFDHARSNIAVGKAAAFNGIDGTVSQCTAEVERGRGCFIGNVKILRCDGLQVVDLFAGIACRSNIGSGSLELIVQDCACIDDAQIGILISQFGKLFQAKLTESCTLLLGQSEGGFVFCHDENGVVFILAQLGDIVHRIGNGNQRDVIGNIFMIILQLLFQICVVRHAAYVGGAAVVHKILPQPESQFFGSVIVHMSDVEAVGGGIIADFAE